MTINKNPYGSRPHHSGTYAQDGLESASMLKPERSYIVENGLQGASSMKPVEAKQTPQPPSKASSENNTKK